MSKRKIVSLYSFAASNTVLSTDGQQVSDGQQMLTEMQRNVQPLQLSYAALPYTVGMPCLCRHFLACALCVIELSLRSRTNCQVHIRKLFSFSNIFIAVFKASLEVCDATGAFYISCSSELRSHG